MSGTLKRTILLGAAVAALLGAGACGRNRAGMLLAPSGTPPGPPAIAAITGQLDFGTPAPHPPVLVMVARVRGTAASSYTSMELTGQLHHARPGPPAAPGTRTLTQLAPKVWVDTLVLVTGEHAVEVRGRRELGERLLLGAVRRPTWTGSSAAPSSTPAAARTSSPTWPRPRPASASARWTRTTTRRPTRSRRWVRARPPSTAAPTACSPSPGWWRGRTTCCSACPGRRRSR